MPIKLNGVDVAEINLGLDRVDEAFFNGEAVFSGDDVLLSIEATHLPYNDEYDTEPPVLTPQSLSGLELTAHYLSGRSVILAPGRYTYQPRRIIGPTGGWFLEVSYRGIEYLILSVRFRIITN